MSRQSSPDFKTKVVLEALKEQFSVEQLAAKYEVDASEINNWKSEFLSKASEVFNKKEKESINKLKPSSEKENLTTVINRLKMENDFLKKKLS